MKKVKFAASVAAAVVSASTLALSAGAYNGYIGVQTQNYSFRNAWTEGNYGAATPYFNSWIAWGSGDAPEESYPEYEDNFDYDINGYVLDATYTDVTIDTDGTYTVKAEGIDWDLQNETDFNLLFVSTDIPADLGVTVSDVTVEIDGNVAKTLDTVTYDETAQYVQFDIANIWNPDVGGWGLDFPTESVAITFTVAGVAGDAAAAEEAAPAEETAAPATGDVAAATDSSKGSPNTGVEDVAAVAGLAVVAAGALVIAKKRK